MYSICVFAKERKQKHAQRATSNQQELFSYDYVKKNLQYVSTLISQK